jgi:hypothetical protein
MATDVSTARARTRARHGAAVLAGLAAVAALLAGVMWLVHAWEGLPPDVPRRELYDDGDPDPG